MATIPKGWAIKRFEELFAEPQRNGIYKTKEFHGRGQKIINMGELFAYDFISAQDMKRVELTPKELEKYLVKDGDLLFARRSLVLEGSGKCSLVVCPSEDTTFESSIIRTRLNQNEAFPKFYYYLFRSPLGRALMSSIATRTAVSGITGSNLVQLRIPHPPLPIQRKIAAILSAYDDLIENNTRRIEILEEMARSLYREWFVNFRFPGHEQVKIVDSELGLIPEGWEVKTIGDACLVGDGAHAKIKRQTSGVLYLTCKNLKEGGLDLSKVDYISEEDYNKYFRDNSKALTKLKADDVIFSIIGTIGEPYLVKPKDYFGISSSVAILRPNKSVLSTNYLYYWVKSHIFQNALNGIKGGVAQGYVSLEMIKSLPLYYPELSIQSQFDVHASSILSLIEVLTRKNINLRKTRDLLLPKLISGEIDVENLDISTGEIAA
jgi:type I restriction enzyme S subunit